MTGAFGTVRSIPIHPPDRDANHCEFVDSLVKRRPVGIEGFF
jgi:hypothetical protein